MAGDVFLQWCAWRRTFLTGESPESALGFVGGHMLVGKLFALNFPLFHRFIESFLCGLAVFRKGEAFC